MLGQGAHTTVKSCVKPVTNQEYAVKVKKLVVVTVPPLGFCNLFKGAVGGRGKSK